MPGNFIDTNVLIYLASGDAVKADRAEKIVSDGGTISIQVLNEFANVARRKMLMPWRDLHHMLGILRDLLSVRPITLEIHETGLALAEQHNLAIYNAMIVASALEAGCDTLWTEDMQHGQMIAGRLRVANPFGGRS